jgi:hypothetical protein
MMPTLHRLFVAVFIATAVVVLPSMPAHAQTPACAGVLVAVDATALGGGVTVRCADGEPSSGLDALTKAGFAFTFVPRIPGMVCQIDGQPDPCNNAPADAYWSYWHKDAGGSWRYATQGAGTYRPAAGSTEGWVFGAGGTPPALPASATTDPPQASPSPHSSSNQSPAETGTQNPDTPTSSADGSDTATAPEPTQDDDRDKNAAPDTDANSETDTGTASVFERFGVEPRQLVGILLLLIGVGALITARRSRPSKPDRS